MGISNLSKFFLYTSSWLSLNVMYVAPRHFRLHYTLSFLTADGPESVSLSSDEVELLEGHSLTPDSIICSATGNPAPSIVWTLRGRIVSTGPRLTLPSPLSRHASGNYTCTASNKYGERSASASINVLHRPECVILKEEDSTGDIILTCEVTAAPPVLGFSWYRRDHWEFFVWQTKCCEICAYRKINEINIEEYTSF